MFKIFIYLLLVCSISFQSTADGMSNKPFMLSVNYGYTQFPRFQKQMLQISDYVTDYLNASPSNGNTVLNFSAKKRFQIDFPFVDSISLGPALYIQHMSYKGSVWELNSRDFNNYHYLIKDSLVDAVLEQDIFLQTKLQNMHPFLSMGLGLSMIDTTYDDYARLESLLNSERHGFGTQKRIHLGIGAGMLFSLSSQLKTNIKYLYTYRGHAHITTSAENNLQELLNSHTLLLGINFLI